MRSLLSSSAGERRDSIGGVGIGHSSVWAGDSTGGSWEQGMGWDSTRRGIALVEGIALMGDSLAYHQDSIEGLVCE